VYDLAIPEASRSQLVQIVSLLLSLTVASFLLQFVRAMAVLRAETRIDEAVQAGVWDHLLRLPARFFRDFTAGDLALRAGGIGPMRQAISGALTGALLTGIFAVWYAGLMFYYDTRMAAWASAALFAIACGSVGLAALQLRHQRRAAVVQTRLSGLVLQLITGLSKLRVAGAEIRAFSRWAHGFAEQRRSYVAARRAGNTLAAVQAAAPVLLLALIYRTMIGAEGASLTTGEFLAFQTALLSLSGATTSITAVFAAGAQALPFFEQVKPILHCRPESDARRADPGELTGDVEIRHVSFAYSEQTPPVLDDVSMHIRAGAFVALVGPSGSGKSSILRLLLGFETAQSGSIYFDGQDIAGLDLHALRRQFGVVLQEAGILAGDLFTNIVGASDATMDDAWEAARIAGLADDIRAMPMGMHTAVDQNGTTISGGQRQRLMIARAIVTRPRILLLDEATSALDNVTQQQVNGGLSALQATRIVVAHRLTTVMNADRIYVFDGGRIVEQGEFHSLIQQRGLFHRLVERQLVRRATNAKPEPLTRQTSLTMSGSFPSDEVVQNAPQEREEDNDERP
jgi:ATP-binding cassette subfamily C protein